MNRHEDTHLPKKCHCEMCDQAFTRMSRLKGHLEIRHSGKSKAKEMSRCKFCSEPRIRALGIHEAACEKRTPRERKQKERIHKTRLRRQDQRRVLQQTVSY